MDGKSLQDRQLQMRHRARLRQVRYDNLTPPINNLIIRSHKQCSKQSLLMINQKKVIRRIFQFAFLQLINKQQKIFQKHNRQTQQMERDSRLIYPEVHAPDKSVDHFDQMRNNPQIYDEVPVSDRSLNTTQSFDSESGIVDQPQDSNSDDLCAESLADKKATLQKWQRKHRRCSIALLVLACLFMACSGFHLLFPPHFDKMMKHGGRGPHDKHAEPRFADEDHERRGGRHHGGGRNLRHEDEEFFMVKNNAEFGAESITFKQGREHGGHHGENKDGEYKVDKEVLQERRLHKLMTRAAFVSFLMWLFIAVAAIIGLKAARQYTDSGRWIMRCSFKKSIIFIVLASMLGIWKLILDKKLMKQFQRFERELEEPGNFGKKHHGEEGRKGGKKEKHHNKDGGRKDRYGRDEDDLEWRFNEIKQMSPQEQDQMFNDLFDQQVSIVFGRGDQRHLSSAAAPEGRRLRSAFDVFDFVNNAISSGVKEAKHNQKDILKKAEKFLEPVAEKVLHESVEDIKKVDKELDNIVNEIVGDLNKAIHHGKKDKDPVVTVVPPEQEVVETEVVVATPIVEMAPPVDTVNACGKDEAVNALGPNKCTQHVECDGMRTCSSYGWCQGVSGCDAAPAPEQIEEIVEIEEPVEEIIEIEEPVEEPIMIEEEPVSEEDLFSLEETEAMKALAEMGRIFDDEDEEKLIKLTEDLTAWINKYAPTFDDPEALLFEVTSSLVTEEMEEGKVDELVIPEAEIVQPESVFEGTSITITFSFGDNEEWFIFEQTTMEPQEQDQFVEYDLDFENVWAQMTKDLNQWDDWSRLNDDDWNSLIELQYFEDTEIDNIIDDFMNQQYDPEFKSFIDSLNVDEVQEFTPEEVQQMYKEKTPSEFKLVLDKLQDYHDIIPIFQSMDEAQLYNYFTGLTDAAWKQTTPTEWQSYIVYLDSQGFKGILDYMTTDEILYVWQFFDERMSEKFISGLNMGDIYAFTQAEWQAAFIGMAPTDFKRIFFDRMDVKGINYVAKQLGDMDDFLEGLTVEDWKNMTAAEWECFLMSTEIEDLVEFVHEMHEVDRKIVYDMFKFMPSDMLEDFRETPELSHEFSKLEMETISHAVEQNESRKESFLDEDFDDYMPEQRMKHHKNRRGHHGKKDGKKGDKKMIRKPLGHGPQLDDPIMEEKRGGKKHEKRQYKKHQNKKGFSSPNEQDKAFFDEAFAWIMDNEDFIESDFGPFYDGLDQIREEKMRFNDDTSEGTSDDTSDGTSDDTSDGSSDSSSESGFANSQSDSEYTDESDYESDSDSDSSEMAPMGRHQNKKDLKRRGGRNNLNGPQRKNKPGKKDRRRNKKHQRAESDDSTSSVSESDEMTSDSEIEDMFLPAMPEDVEPVDLAYIPRASMDKRHGGRHLHGKKGGKHGKKDGKYGKKGCHKGQGGKNGAEEGHHGKGGKRHHGGKGGHHDKGHKMVWCLVMRTILYSALVTTFLCIYKKFICAFRSYHNTVALSQQTSNMSVEERNKAYLNMTTGSRCQRKCVQRQVAAPQQNQAQYVPPCAAPMLGNDALTQQSLVAPPQGAPITAPQPQSQMAPHQATYTLDQVKELLALERQRLACQ